MRRHDSTIGQQWRAFFGLSALLMTAGCGSDGDSVSRFFGIFGGSGSGSEAVGTIAGGGSMSGGTSPGPQAVATLHQPEPASLALFGGGLAAVALLRRRKRATSHRRRATR